MLKVSHFIPALMVVALIGCSSRRSSIRWISRPRAASPSSMSRHKNEVETGRPCVGSPVPPDPSLDEETFHVGATAEDAHAPQSSCLDGLEVMYVLPVRGDGTNL